MQEALRRSLDETVSSLPQFRDKNFGPAINPQPSIGDPKPALSNQSHDQQDNSQDPLVQKFIDERKKRKQQRQEETLKADILAEIQHLEMAGNTAIKADVRKVVSKGDSPKLTGTSALERSKLVNKILVEVVEVKPVSETVKNRTQIRDTASTISNKKPQTGGAWGESITTSIAKIFSGSPLRSRSGSESKAEGNSVLTNAGTNSVRITNGSNDAVKLILSDPKNMVSISASSTAPPLRSSTTATVDIAEPVGSCPPAGAVFQTAATNVTSEHLREPSRASYSTAVPCVQGDAIDSRIASHQRHQSANSESDGDYGTVVSLDDEYKDILNLGSNLLSSYNRQIESSKANNSSSSNIKHPRHHSRNNSSHKSRNFFDAPSFYAAGSEFGSMNNTLQFNSVGSNPLEMSYTAAFDSVGSPIASYLPNSNDLMQNFKSDAEVAAITEVQSFQPIYSRSPKAELATNCDDNIPEESPITSLDEQRQSVAVTDSSSTTNKFLYKSSGSTFGSSDAAASTSEDIMKSALQILRRSLNNPSLQEESIRSAVSLLEDALQQPSINTSTNNSHYSFALPLKNRNVAHAYDVKRSRDDGSQSAAVVSLKSSSTKAVTADGESGSTPNRSHHRRNKDIVLDTDRMLEGDIFGSNKPQATQSKHVALQTEKQSTAYSKIFPDSNFRSTNNDFEANRDNNRRSYERLFEINLPVTNKHRETALLELLGEETDRIHRTSITEASSSEATFNFQPYSTERIRQKDSYGRPRPLSERILSASNVGQEDFSESRVIWDGKQGSRSLFSPRSVVTTDDFYPRSNEKDLPNLSFISSNSPQTQHGENSFSYSFDPSPLSIQLSNDAYVHQNNPQLNSCDRIRRTDSFRSNDKFALRAASLEAQRHLQMDTISPSSPFMNLQSNHSQSPALKSTRSFLDVSSTKRHGRQLSRSYSDLNDQRPPFVSPFDQSLRHSYSPHSKGVPFLPSEYSKSSALPTHQANLYSEQEIHRITRDMNKQLILNGERNLRSHQRSNNAEQVPLHYNTAASNATYSSREPTRNSFHAESHLSRTVDSTHHLSVRNSNSSLPKIYSASGGYGHLSSNSNAPSRSSFADPPSLSEPLHSQSHSQSHYQVYGHQNFGMDYPQVQMQPPQSYHELTIEQSSTTSSITEDSAFDNNHIEYFEEPPHVPYGANYKQATNYSFNNRNTLSSVNNSHNRGGVSNVWRSSNRSATDHGQVRAATSRYDLNSYASSSRNNGSWNCSMCTLLNKPTFLSCEVCGAVRTQLM